jgi:3-methyladenine DNA glycosylase/8-oxoguanine DNA glycosylase
VAARAAFAKQHGAGGGLSEELKKERDELEARVKLLAELDEKYEDLGEAAAPPGESAARCTRAAGRRGPASAEAVAAAAAQAP